MLVRSTKTASEMADDARRAAFEAKFPGVIVSLPGARGGGGIGLLGHARVQGAATGAGSTIVVSRPGVAPRPAALAPPRRPPTTRVLAPPRRVAQTSARVPARDAVRVLGPRELGALAAFAARLNKKRARA